MPPRFGRIARSWVLDGSRPRERRKAAAAPQSTQGCRAGGGCGVPGSGGSRRSRAERSGWGAPGVCDILGGCNSERSGGAGCFAGDWITRKGRRVGRPFRLFRLWATAQGAALPGGITALHGRTRSAHPVQPGALQPPPSRCRLEAPPTTRQRHGACGGFRCTTPRNGFRPHRCAPGSHRTAAGFAGRPHRLV